MLAVDQDPTQQVAANRLAQLYRDKGDVKALVAMLDRRARLLTPLLSQNGEIRPVVAGLHEELGKLWSEPPLLQPKKAIENYRRAIELDPESAFAIYSVRELYKSLGQWDDAASMYALELAL
jgi:tetratricopeptide (TPR) repeat protein